jgi:hypothetical protein
MSVLLIAICCWFAGLALFVALRIRATMHRSAPARPPMREAQLRALGAHAGHRQSLHAAHSAGHRQSPVGAHSAGDRRSLLAAGQRR